MNVKDGDCISAVALVVEAANGDSSGADAIDPDAPEQPELEAATDTPETETDTPEAEAEAAPEEAAAEAAEE